MWATIAAPGPSPRAWGLPPGAGPGPREGRAISTCVGTTTTTQLAGQHNLGHPHVRGDYGGGHHALGTPDGPSPRAWGLLSSWATSWSGGRAIPTCVGTTVPHWTTRDGRPGHPHVRGDSASAHSVTGLAIRAIPTCVGTTLDQDGENARSPPAMCLFGRSFGKGFSSSAAPGEGVRVGRLGHLTTRASRARRAMLRAMRAKAMRA